jgi:osmotically-inducible protein OsmY
MKIDLDVLVSQRARDALYQDRALRQEAAGIRVFAEHGTVTLEGIVSCRGAKARAYEAVRVVDGVFHIEDRLTIRAP